MTPTLSASCYLTALLCGCVPFQHSPAPLPPDVGREMTVGAGVLHTRSESGSTPPGFAGHVSFQAQHRVPQSSLRFDWGGALAGETVFPSASLGAFGRLGAESRFGYAGLQAGLGLLYAGGGPVLAIGYEPFWFYGAANAYFVPLGDGDVFTQGAAGVSLSLSDRFALSLGGDYVRYKYTVGGFLTYADQGDFFRAALVLAYRDVGD